VLGYRGVYQGREVAFWEVPERLELIRSVLGDRERVEVTAFSGLLVDFARERGAPLIIRGLRAVSDFEYEFQMARMNRSLWSDIETIFLAPDNRYTFLSASLVREVARLGGDVSEYVPAEVLERMVERFGPSARGDGDGRDAGPDPGLEPGAPARGRG